MGFEPSRVAADYTSARGIPVINDYFSVGAARGHGTFDVISLNLVLEHLRDPIGLIEEAKRMLAPGGLLFVISPNDFNPLQMMLWRDLGYAPCGGPAPPPHYFDSVSAGRFFSARGFETLHQETSYPLEMFLLSGRNYIGNDSVGRECHQERKAFELALFRHDKPLILSLGKSWNAQGIGREFVILGRRDDRVKIVDPRKTDPKCPDSGVRRQRVQGKRNDAC